MQVSADWLLHGQGDMILPKPSFATGRPHVRIEAPDYGHPMTGDLLVNGVDHVIVRQFDVVASAGPGTLLRSEEVIDQMIFNADWLRKRRVSPDLAGLVRIEGVSMAPVIPDGALVLVDMGATAFFREGIHLFRYREELFVKHLTPLEADVRERPTRLLVSSSNAEHSPYIVGGEDLADLTILARVVSVITDV